MPPSWSIILLGLNVCVFARRWRRSCSQLFVTCGSKVFEKPLSALLNHVSYCLSIFSCFVLFVVYSARRTDTNNVRTDSDSSLGVIFYVTTTIALCISPANARCGLESHCLPGMVLRLASLYHLRLPGQGVTKTSSESLF